MLQTIEAIIEPSGAIRLLEEVYNQPQTGAGYRT
jgi:hypothetical protein